MTILLKLLQESILGSFQELMGNKLRAILSVLGVTIGIFCIIAVFSAVDSLEKNVRNSFEKLGENVIYIQKFPWTEDPRMNWFKYFRRPTTTYNEFKLLQEKVSSAEAVAIMVIKNGRKVKHQSYLVEDVDLFAVTHDYYRIKDFEFEDGRYFSSSESHRGSRVAVIGSNIASELFPNQKQIVGRSIKFLDRELTITGVLKKEGEDIIGFSSDNNIYVPYNFVKTVMNLDGVTVEPFIAIKAKENVSQDEMMDEVRGFMRSIRKLKPLEDDNFSLNQLSIISSALTAVFSVINFAGLLIGLFSILVGGFGIANIMFVSVKERTNLIGIKKALGAKQSFILLEFLIEAIMLCLLGGLLGVALVYGGSRVWEALRHSWDIAFYIQLSMKNVYIGLILSVGIGILAGFIPALTASRMKPVDAIRG